MSAASCHCEVPEMQVDPLVGKEKSEPLQLSPMLQECWASPMTTAYALNGAGPKVASHCDLSDSAKESSPVLAEARMRSCN